MNALSQRLVDRRAERTHLFLVATLYFERTSNPVRVRNLSAKGAMIEGACLPSVGTEIVLRRGELEAVGTTVWSESAKAGLSFSGILDVSAWLPVKEAKRQTQIDQVTFEWKQGARAVDVVAAPAVNVAMPMAAVVADLVSLQAQLGQLGDKLADDAILLVSHPELQFLDAAGQRIGKIIQAIRSAKA